MEFFWLVFHIEFKLGNINRNANETDIEFVKIIGG